MAKRPSESSTPTKTKLQLPYFVLPLTMAGHFFYKENSLRLLCEPLCALRGLKKTKMTQRLR